jgi:hypothetical protein
MPMLSALRGGALEGASQARLSHQQGSVIQKCAKIAPFAELSSDDRRPISPKLSPRVDPQLPMPWMQATGSTVTLQHRNTVGRYPARSDLRSAIFALQLRFLDLFRILP